MLKPARKGFSLIELMVVVAIMGILVVAKTTFFRGPKKVKRDYTPLEFVSFPNIVAKNKELLTKWANPNGLSTPNTRERKEFLNDIKNDFAIEMPNILYTAQKGSAIVAGGLVILKSTSSAAGILSNTGSWTALPAEEIHPPRDPKEPRRNYYNTVAYAGVWRSPTMERVVMILVDEVEKKETFKFYVNGELWAGTLKRTKGGFMIDDLNGEVESPDKRKYSFIGKIPRYFPDCGDMPSGQLVSKLNDEGVYPLKPSY